MCTMAMIQLSDPAIFSGIAVTAVTGNVQQFLFQTKTVLTSVAAALPALWLRMIPNLSYCTSQKYATEAGFMKHILQSNFLSRA